MAPPTFADLGKQARDLFTKGYNHGLIKVETTTQGNENGSVEFKTNASHNLANEKLTGNVDIKYKVPQYGLVLTEKWNTEGVLGTVIEINNQFARGLKTTLDTSYTPNTGKRDALLKTEWTNENVKVNGNLTLIGGPVANLSGVYSHNGFLFGVSNKYDFSTNESKTTSVAFGFEHPLYTIHSYTNDGREFGGSFYQRVSKNVELGAQLGWVSGEDKTSYAVGSSYKISPDLLLRAKIDNKSNIGLGVTHGLSPNVKFSVSSQFSLTAANTEHKLGCGLEFTA
jgi:hypothetical protein